MAGEIVLGIRLTADGSGLVGAVKLSRSEIDKLEKETGQVGRAARKAANDTGELERRQRTLSATTRGLRSGIRTLAGAAGFAGLTVAAVALTRGIFSTASSFEQLRLQLETVSGSAELARIQFDQIKEFAARTPFEVQNLVASFTRLQAAGITPTMQLMEAFGNTAAAFGRDITEFADAVIGAVTGETERLKAFGIVARIEGEKMTLNFRGRSVQVRRDAQEITQALAEIGATEFAGGMARQTQSLAGAISNAQDAVSAFFDELGRAGLVDTATDSVNAFTRAMEHLRRVNFPTLAEQIEDVNGTINRLQGELDEMERSTTQFLLKGAATGRAFREKELADAKQHRGELLRQLESQLRREDQARLDAWQQEQAAEREREEERRRREAAVFAEKRAKAKEHLEDLYADRLQAQGRDAELIDLQTERELRELQDLHEAKLISEAEYLEAEFGLRQTAMERLEELRRQNDPAAKAEEWRRRQETAEAEHAARMKVIWESGLRGKMQIASTMLGQISTLMESSSRRMFEVGKAAAIAQTIIDTYAAAQSAYRNFAWNPPLAFAMAAAATLAGLARVQQIRSTQFQGGGSATAAGLGGGAAGGGASAPAPQPSITPVPAPEPEREREKRRSVVYLTVSGQVFTRDWLAYEFLPQLNELVADGAELRLRR